MKTIKGDKNFGYIMINTKGNEMYLISQKKDYYYRKLINAIKCCMNNYK